MQAAARFVRLYHYHLSAPLARSVPPQLRPQVGDQGRWQVPSHFAFLGTITHGFATSPFTARRPWRPISSRQPAGSIAISRSNDCGTGLRRRPPGGGAGRPRLPVDRLRSESAFIGVSASPAGPAGSAGRGVRGRDGRFRLPAGRRRLLHLQHLSPPIEREGSPPAFGVHCRKFVPAAFTSSASTFCQGTPPRRTPNVGPTARGGRKSQSPCGSWRPTVAGGSSGCGYARWHELGQKNPASWDEFPLRIYTAGQVRRLFAAVPAWSFATFTTSGTKSTIPWS